MHTNATDQITLMFHAFLFMLHNHLGFIMPDLSRKFWEYWRL